METGAEHTLTMDSAGGAGISPGSLFSFSVSRCLSVLPAAVPLSARTL